MCLLELKGITQVLELEWDSIRDHGQMVVLPTLEDVDVILGMDVISRLDVQISGRSKAAVPRPEGTTSEPSKWVRRWLFLLESQGFSSWQIRWPR